MLFESSRGLRKSRSKRRLASISHKGLEAMRVSRLFDFDLSGDPFFVF